MILTAISPRLAIRIFENMGARDFTSPSHQQERSSA
jgi:hypothetical protein